MLSINSSAQSTGLSNLLKTNQSAINKTLQQLASGLAINKASDNPSGLVISNQLRAQITGFDQAIENSQRASNIVNTAEGGLSNISSLLTEARTLAVEAANDGGLDSGQKSALQNQLNSILSSIDRISNSTGFGGKQLLNGEQSFNTDNVDPAIENIEIDSATTGTVSVDVSAVATQATASGTIAATQAADATVLVQGANGSAEVSIQAGATQAEIEDAINAVTDTTGVVASGGQVQSSDVGSDQTVTITNIEGQIDGVSEGTVAGTDVVATVNGASTTATGNTIDVSSSSFSGQITLDAAATTGTITFDVTGGGASFQLGQSAGTSESLGIRSFHSSNLGGSAGRLSSLISGGSSSLSENPGQALSIIDNAISQTSRQRASIGAFQTNTLDTNISSLRQSVLDLTDSESRIRDLDFARGSANLIRQQLLQQSTISAAAQSNTNNASILSLLGS